MTTLYGIANCDTVKKARARLDAAGVGYHFHDYKRAGADPAALDRWIAAVGWGALLNRAGTTFRNLAEADRTDIEERSARALMLTHPTLIKRPVVEHGSDILIGLKVFEWEQAACSGIVFA